ncbi:MAG: hypothetical protein U5K74_08445 [Gemmatimonadaceae bacterium]|nr:hypothetical protein [Gemmatimonadaceae bacterium]
MRSALLQQASQAAAPAAAEARAAAAAQEAQLDARIEVAAKKAALAGLEAQVGPVPPMPPGMPSGRIVIERDGKTIILDNPTAEQIAAVGGVGTPQRELPVGAMLTMTSMVLGTIIVVTALVLRHRRAVRGVPAGGASAVNDARMARLENAIESIAVEVERISEGQRYTSKLLAEGASVPVGAGSRHDAVLSSRTEN